jgi:predicted TIM-barrel fold metal-dependent hydrolase
MIIDFHEHIGWNKDKTLVVNNKQLLKEQKKACIDYTIAFPLESVDPYYKEFNKIVLELSKQKSIIGFMRLRPMINVKDFFKKNAKNFNGVKVHPYSDKFGVEEFREIVDSAVKHDMPVIFHSSKEIMTDFEPVFKEFPKAKLIAAHATAYKIYDKCYQKYKNLYYETSIKMSPISMKRLAEIDSNRILFGSDYPFSIPLIEKMRIELCPKDYLTREQKDKILGLNAKKLLNL